MVPDYAVTLHWGSGAHSFRLRGGPIDDPDSAPELFRLLGWAGSSWARLENHIDAILLQINQPYGSNKQLNLHDPTFPRRFSDKTRLLKKYFRRHPALKSHSEGMLALIVDLEVFAPFRNDFLHGIIEAYDPSNGHFTINSVQVHPKTGVATVQRIVRELVAVKEFAAKVNRANDWLANLSAQIFTPEGREQFQ